MAQVTVKTLAAAVGVSTSTISNAYNRPDQLSPQLRRRILAQAEALGYAGPHAAARTLRDGRAGAVGVVLTEQLSYAFSDPYAVGFLTGLSEVVEQRGTSIVLLPVAARAEEPDVTAVRQANVDALTTLYVSDTHPASLLARVRGLRLVSTAVDLDPESSWVAIDDEEAGRLVGEHLAALGHRRVAVVVDAHRAAGSPARQLSERDIGCRDCSARLRGLRSVLPEEGLVVVSSGHNAVESGATAAELVLGFAEPPTAVVGTSDVLAIGVLRTLRARGLSAGDDVSVCGFDDIPAAADAGLTTLRQPIREKGRRVGELLLDADLPDRQVLLPTGLVVRASTGPARPR